MNAVIEDLNPGHGEDLAGHDAAPFEAIEPGEDDVRLFFGGENQRLLAEDIPAETGQDQNSTRLS